MRAAFFSRSNVLGFALFFAALAITGCGPSQPPTESQKNINTYNLAQKEVAEARADVENTLTVLNHYTEAPDRAAFDDFKKYAKAVQAHKEAIQNIAAVMSDQGASFFTNWAQEIAAMTDKDLQTAAQAKRAAALRAFQQIDIQGPDLRASYERFVSDINNLQTFFDYDKSKTGLAAAATLIGQTRVHGGDLQRLLDIQATNLANVKNVFLAMDRH